MGKHKGSQDPKELAGTDAGKPFDQLTPQEKGAEFDASDRDPKGYAERNFQAGQSLDEQYNSARAEQRNQQNKK